MSSRAPIFSAAVLAWRKRLSASRYCGVRLAGIVEPSMQARAFWCPHAGLDQDDQGIRGSDALPRENQERVQVQLADLAFALYPELGHTHQQVDQRIHIGGGVSSEAFEETSTLDLLQHLSCIALADWAGAQRHILVEFGEYPSHAKEQDWSEQRVWRQSD